MPGCSTRASRRRSSRGRSRGPDYAEPPAPQRRRYELRVSRRGCLRWDGPWSCACSLRGAARSRAEAVNASWSIRATRRQHRFLRRVGASPRSPLLRHGALGKPTAHGWHPSARAARLGLGVFRRLVEITASSQAWLHRLDVAAGAELAPRPPASSVGSSGSSHKRGPSSMARRPEVARRAPPDRVEIRHLPWRPAAGSILVEGALDQRTRLHGHDGCRTGPCRLHRNELDVAPIDNSCTDPTNWRGRTVDVGSIHRRYLRETGADLTNQSYYEALRCESELTNVVSYRLARAANCTTLPALRDGSPRR
jgi:hypothetical protein